MKAAQQVSVVTGGSGGMACFAGMLILYRCGVRSLRRPCYLLSLGKLEPKQVFEP